MGNYLSGQVKVGRMQGAKRGKYDCVSHKAGVRWEDKRKRHSKGRRLNQEGRRVPEMPKSFSMDEFSSVKTIYVYRKFFNLESRRRWQVS